MPVEKNEPPGTTSNESRQGQCSVFPRAMLSENDSESVSFFLGGGLYNANDLSLGKAQSLTLPDPMSDMATAARDSHSVVGCAPAGEAFAGRYKEKCLWGSEAGDVGS